jgi:5-methylcytosine-specific restriction enzyme subunit McrC
MRPTVLRVFEHEVIRPEERTLEGALVPKSLDLGALTRFNDAHEQRYFTFGWQSLKFTSYVGYLQIGDVAFEILPKADRGHTAGAAGRWKRALLAMLEVATGMRLYTPSKAAQWFDQSSLLDLVAASFLEEVAVLLREGLARSYRAHESNGTVFRGRLLAPENLRTNLVRPDRFYARFTTFDADVLVNQLVGEALRMVADLPIAPGLRARACEHAFAFADVSPRPLDSRVFERVPRSRATSRYENALVLARMLLERRTPALAHGGTTVLAFLFDMNRLWERYVAALFHRARVPGVVVRAQERRAFWEAAGVKRGVTPDLVVREAATGKVLLVGDTKWKIPSGGIPSDDDLKQMFVYNEVYSCPDAVLLYPSAAVSRSPRSGEFAIEEQHVCRTAFLGLFDGEELRRHAMQAEVTAMMAGALRARAADQSP